jgi:1-aminocyclopropane-1-carboxylate deaminase
MIKLMQLFDVNNSKLEELQFEDLKNRNIKLLVKRDDLIDPYVSGNKWRKLKFNIEIAQLKKSEAILTFGGAFSNHLLATAAACRKAGIRSIGVVRGEELNSQSNDCLRDCATLGMEFRFVDRNEYLLRGDASYKASLQSEYPNSYLIPEGGANYYGLMGCSEIWKEIDVEVDHIFTAAGTGTTAAGLLIGKPKNSKIHLVSALKGNFQLKQVEELLFSCFLDEELKNSLLNDLHIYEEYHFGGYAKTTPALFDFIEDMKLSLNLPLDPVYTGKTFYGMLEEVRANSSYDNTTICFLHTGGLLGSRGYQQ